MPVALNITLINADGTTNSVVDLSNGTSTMVLAYTPLSPQETVVDFDPGALGDGGERLGSGYRNVTEPLELLILGATPAAVRTTIHTIELALQAARRYTRKKVFPRAYVNFVPEGAGGILLQSELFSGQLTFGPTTVDMWNTAKSRVMISWTRRFYWESLTDVQLSLSNKYATNTTSGIQVDNVNDGTHDNFVTIAGAVQGVLPAPIRLELTHNTNDAAHMNNIYVGVAGYGDGTSYTELMLEGEWATGGSQLPGTIDTATYSSGYYRQASYAIDSTEHQLFEWTLTQTMLNATRGQLYRLMARFATIPTGYEWVRFRLYYQGLTVLWEGPLIELPVSSLADLGEVRLPPWSVGLNAQNPITLRMYATTYVGSGTQTISLDTINLFPTYNWRRYTARGYGLPYGIRLVDDAINGYLYQDGWGAPGGRTGYYGALGSPLMIDPNATQQFYFAWDTQSGSAEITRQATIKMFYRPRFLTV